MGAGASAAGGPAPSATDVGQWSKEDVGERVASIGPAFAPYKDIVMNQAIDGQTLLDLDDDELEEYGVTMKAHRKRILKMVDEARGKPAPQPATAVAS